MTVVRDYNCALSGDNWAESLAIFSNTRQGTGSKMVSRTVNLISTIVVVSSIYDFISFSGIQIGVTRICAEKHGNIH